MKFKKARNYRTDVVHYLKEGSEAVFLPLCGVYHSKSKICTNYKPPLVPADDNAVVTCERCLRMLGPYVPYHEPNSTNITKEYNYGNNIKAKSILGADCEITVNIHGATYTFDLGNLVSWLKKKDPELFYRAIEKRLKG